MTGILEIILPLGILIIGAFSIYVLTRIFNLSNRFEALMAAALLLAAMISMVLQIQRFPQALLEPVWSFGNQESGGVLFRQNALGIFVFLIASMIAILVCIYSGEYLSRDSRYLVYYPLILLTLAGLLGMFYSTDLFNLFLLTELTTITGSSLVAFRYHEKVAISAGFKYLIMSSVGTMFMLLGIYFVFRQGGNLNLVEISMLNFIDSLIRIGSACFLMGFALKAGVVPLHTWVPDVYSYAPSAVSGLLGGIISKSMLFMMPVICLRLGMTKEELGMFLLVFSLLNMLLGSIRALNQQLLRRFLSYSSIAQTGYLMFGLGIGFYYGIDLAFSGALFMLLAVAVMKSLAFLSAGIYEYYSGSQKIAILQGGHKYFPAQAFNLSIALAGLAGIPLLAGFIGKWMVFSAALFIGDFFAVFCLIIFFICTLISLGGYLPVLVKQYQSSGTNHLAHELHQGPLKVSKWMSIPGWILTALVVLMGIFPNMWVEGINKVISWLSI